MIFDLSHIILAQEGAAPPGGGGSNMFIFLGLMLVMMYFLTIRPQRIKQKKHQEQLDALKTGDNVISAGGIHGRVANIKEKTVIVKVAENVKMEFDKSSVATVIKKDQPEKEAAGDAETGKVAEKA